MNTKTVICFLKFVLYCAGVGLYAILLFLAVYMIVFYTKHYNAMDTGLLVLGISGVTSGWLFGHYSVKAYATCKEWFGLLRGN